MNTRGKISLLFALYMCIFSCLTGKSEAGVDEDIKKLLKDYDANKAPGFESGKATDVYISIYVKRFDDVSESKGEISLAFYLRLQWKDPRLAHNNKEVGKLDLRSIDQSVWKPDIFIRNAISSQRNKFLYDNHVMKVYENGKIWYSTQMTVKLKCNMQLMKFPFDVQVCPIIIESFSNKKDVIDIKFMENNAVDFEPMLSIHKYTLTDTEKIDCSTNYTSGIYPCLTINFRLRRDYGYYFFSEFIPSIFTVALSWLGFWLPQENTGARMATGLFSFLMMMSLSLYMTATMPQVSYMTAIQVWNICCTIGVFSTLVVVTATVAKSNCFRKNSFEKSGESQNQSVSKMDLVCRVFYPVSFIIFMIIYFGIYTA